MASTIKGLREFLQGIAETHYEQHRLAYVHKEDDGTELFVCKCNEGFERRSFNAHIRDTFAAVLK